MAGTLRPIQALARGPLNAPRIADAPFSYAIDTPSDVVLAAARLPDYECSGNPIPPKSSNDATDPTVVCSVHPGSSPAAAAFPSLTDAIETGGWQRPKRWTSRPFPKKKEIK